MSAAEQFISTSEIASAPARPRFDPFRVLTSSERRRQLDGYLAFLRERDGEMDFPRRTLARREAYFADLSGRPVVWQGEAAVDGFYQHLHKVGKPPLDARTLWLLAAAKANQMESYGVEGEVAKWLRRGYSREDEVVLYDLLEEQYHSRILLEVCRTAGLGGVHLAKPDWLARALLHVMQHFPDRIRFVLITCGEILGCIVFQVLLENCHLFAEEPEVEERLRSLLSEILLDETGHVLYCRAHLPGFGLRVAEALIPWVTGFMMKDVPELRSLGLDQRELARRTRMGIEIPPEFDWLERDPPS